MKIWDNIFDWFFEPVLTNRDKNEDEDEKFGKMSPIFELSISKLGYVCDFDNNPRNNSWPILNTFLTLFKYFFD